MKTVIIGLGNQGKKRLENIEKDLVATVDPINKKADFKDIEEVPISSYDSAIVAVQEEYKYEIILYLLKNKKNILVEKPLYFKDKNKLKKIFNIAQKKNVTLYVAYNHRFEQSIKYVTQFIQSRKLGKLYACELYYGNGTSKLIKKNKWRDSNLGVITDLGSHLLDLIYLWFGDIKLPKLELINSNRFENKAPDYAIISGSEDININLKASYCSWKNKFTIDLYFENGSLHTSSLEKWENVKVLFRKRSFPSGKPIEKKIMFKKNQETWIKEYRHFKRMIKNKINYDYKKDLWIQKNFDNFKLN